LPIRNPSPPKNPSPHKHLNPHKKSDPKTDITLTCTPDYPVGYCVTEGLSYGNGPDNVKRSQSFFFFFLMWWWHSNKKLIGWVSFVLCFLGRHVLYISYTCSAQAAYCRRPQSAHHELHRHQVKSHVLLPAWFYQMDCKGKRWFYKLYNRTFSVDPRPST
jgi:hypothetical protein